MIITLKRIARVLAALACAISAASVAAPPSNGNSPETGLLDRVKALRDPVIEGAVPTYYTPGYEKHARDLQRFITGELHFYETQFPIHLSLSLAVLDAAQWQKAEKQIPYQVPSVDGEPPVALMPASWANGSGSSIPKPSDADRALVKAVAAHGLHWDEANYRATDLIGGHELGHAVNGAYGIVPGTRWLNEMLASYALYAYLQHQRRDLLWEVAFTRAGGQLDRPQHHVSLDDFDSQYMQIVADGSGNYPWYQAQFFQQIEKVYAKQGIGFLKKVRAAFPPGAQPFALGNAKTLRRLEKISPGFIAWAHYMETRPRMPAPAAKVASKKDARNG